MSRVFNNALAGGWWCGRYDFRAGDSLGYLVGCRIRVCCVPSMLFHIYPVNLHYQNRTCHESDGLVIAPRFYSLLCVRCGLIGPARRCGSSLWHFHFFSRLHSVRAVAPVAYPAGIIAWLYGACLLVVLPLFTQHVVANLSLPL